MLKNETYRLAYNFHRKWAPFPADAAGWERAGLEAAAVCYLHGNDPFLTDLVVAVMEDFGREYEKAGGSKAINDGSLS